LLLIKITFKNASPPPPPSGRISVYSQNRQQQMVDVGRLQREARMKQAGTI
jgi:hypothetical protein